MSSSRAKSTEVPRERLKRRARFRRLPSTDELLAAVETVLGAARAAGEDVAISGSLAMQVWGSRHLSADLDFVAESTLGLSGEPLRVGGVRALVDQVVVRVFVRDDAYQGLYEDALSHAVLAVGLPAPVVEPEYLATMKMLSGRGTYDELDVHHLVLTPDFDSPRTEAILREHLGPYAVRVYRWLVAEAVFQHERREELVTTIAEFRAERAGRDATPEDDAWARSALRLEESEKPPRGAAASKQWALRALGFEESPKAPREKPR